LHLKLLRRFKDIAVSVVGSFILPHPVVPQTDLSLVVQTTRRPLILFNIRSYVHDYLASISVS